MALDPLQITILETTEKLIESNKKTQDKIEKAAQGDGRKKSTKIAIATLKKQEEIRKGQINLFGVSKKRLDKADKLGISIQAQEKVIAEQKKIIEDSGQDASKNKELNKLQYKLDKDKNKRSKFLGSASAEDSKKEGATNKGILGYLKQTAGFLGGIAKQGMEKVKSGLGGFSKFLFGALAVAALAFLDHPKFKEIIITLKDVVIPALAYLYDNVIKPLAIYIGGLLTDLFKDLKSYVDGEKGLGAVIYDNIGIIAGIVTMLAPGLVFGSLKLAVTGLIKMIALLAKGGIFAKIGVAFTAMKTFFVGLAAKLSFGAIFAKIGIAFAALKTFFIATLMPFLAAAAVPIAIIVGVVAGIVLAIYSLKKGFDDFMFELEATGSIWEATKTGIVTVISNILGLPFDLLKDGVSWIIGKIGSIFGLESFTNASKVLDDFSFVDMMKDMLTFLGDSISGVFDGFMQVIQDFLRSGPLKFIGGGFAADALFGTVEKQATEKKIEEAQQKRMVEDRKALREKQKLEKEIEEAKKLEKLKAEQNALQPKAPANLNLKVPSAAAGAGSNIISAPTSVVTSNSSSNTTTSTPVRQPNRVIGQLASAY